MTMYTWVALVIAIVILVAVVAFSIWAMNQPTPKEEEPDAPEPSEEDWDDDTL